MRILITGASGFIGPAVARRFAAANCNVVGLVRKSSDTTRLAAMDCEIRYGDILDAESLSKAMADCDVVVHLAGLTRARKATQLQNVNAQGTRNLAQACAEQSETPRLILVSSLAAAGLGTLEKPRREADKCEPVSQYGSSKLLGELAARETANQVPTSIIRPPMVFGPGDRDGLLLARTISRLGWQVAPRRGLPLSVIHVDDLAEAIWQVSRSGQRLPADRDSDDHSQGVYHVAHTQATSLQQIGEWMAVGLDRRVRTLKVRPWVYWIVAAVGEIRNRLGGAPSLLNFDKYREATAPGWVMSSEKIGEELGFSPAGVLPEQFASTMQCYLHMGWLG